MGLPVNCSCSITTIPSPTGGIAVLRVAGEVDVGGRHVVWTALTALFERLPSHALVDLSGLEFCDVRSLAMLVDAGAGAHAYGIEFAVTAMPQAVERRWSLMWPDSRLPTRFATLGAGVLAAVAGQNEHRARTGAGPRPARARLRAVPDLGEPDGERDDVVG